MGRVPGGASVRKGDSMTIQEFYESMGVDYQNVLRRLSSETLAKKYLLKLREDPSFSHLTRAMEEEAYQDAFAAAHTLKGVCLNLGLETLGEASSCLTELLRTHNPDLEQVQAQLTVVAAAYRDAMEKINLLST